VTAEVRHNLFLAFKETLNNVVRHAAATEVRVTVSLGAPGLELMVQDNGRGFDFSAVSSSLEPGGGASPLPARVRSGNGLLNLRRRLEEMGGQCGVASVPGSGTAVRFTVPLALPGN
jgi:signal transduction histidine kinase